jgi:hypothetical protein
MTQSRLSKAMGKPHGFFIGAPAMARDASAPFDPQKKD